MLNHPSTYQTYMLRCWSESKQVSLPVWRFSLEEVGTGKRYGFADLQLLVNHLHSTIYDPDNKHDTNQH